MLAAATPYFHAMFTSGLIESEFERTRLIESFVEVNLMVISQRFESLKKEKGQERRGRKLGVVRGIEI